MVLPPALVPAADALVAAVSSEGKLLVFPVSEVPEMPRGKGNKLYDIAGKKAAAREECMTARRGGAARGRACCCGRASSAKTLEWAELKDYRGSTRAARQRSARGWPRKIDRLEARALLPA